jgi:transcriptional regulator with XRE-family HTH domain
MTPKKAKQLREKLGLTQVALARKLGVHPMTISKWERGAEPIMKQTALVLRLLAEAEGRK